MSSDVGTGQMNRLVSGLDGALKLHVPEGYPLLPPTDRRCDQAGHDDQGADAVDRRAGGLLPRASRAW
jgi:hypothetical protein